MSLARAKQRVFGTGVTCNGQQLYSFPIKLVLVVIPCSLLYN